MLHDERSQFCTQPSRLSSPLRFQVPLSLNLPPPRSSLEPSSSSLLTRRKKPGVSFTAMLAPTRHVPHRAQLHGSGEPRRRPKFLMTRTYFSTCNRTTLHCVTLSAMFTLRLSQHSSLASFADQRISPVYFCTCVEEGSHRASLSLCARKLGALSKRSCSCWMLLLPARRQ